MINRGCTLMSQEFTKNWLQNQAPYSSLYTNDFYQKYPRVFNGQPSASFGTEQDSNHWKNKNYYYASTYRADFSEQPSLPRTFNNMKSTKNWACMADHTAIPEKTIKRTKNLASL